MDLVKPEYLLRPKERTFDGICEYLAEARKELKKAEAKKNASKDVIIKSLIRIQIHWQKRIFIEDSFFWFMEFFSFFLFFLILFVFFFFVFFFFKI